MKNFYALSFLVLASLLSSSNWATAAQAEEEFKPLFNGRDLTGWDGESRFWSVRDGAITGQTTADNPTKGNTFLIWRGGTVEDFQLRLSFRIIGNNPGKQANSGIQYRSKDLANWVVSGYQADFEAGKTYSGILYEERGRGILAQRGQRTVINENGKIKVLGSTGNPDEIQAAIRPEEWNEYVIMAQGTHLIHLINGRVTADVTDHQRDKRAFSGLLALQLHAGPPMTVQFKDIRIKRLKPEGAKRIVLVAGTPSHGPGDHEFNAGVLLLKKCLDETYGVQAAAYLNGWPKDPSAFDAADAILLYMDGGAGHPVIKEDHLQVMGDLMKLGVGLACVHYAVEAPKDKGGPQLLEWIGGYFEPHWSINPHWDADFKELPEHPISRGVNPFKIRDEWYYHMRFPENMKGVTPILTAVPPESTRNGPDGAHSGNQFVRARKGMPEHVAWAVERPNGGRGFGFTGGHFHRNWGDDNFRKLVLNALLWVAKADLPPNGVSSKITEEDLKKNLDPKGRRQASKPSEAPARSGIQAAREQLKSIKAADGLEASLFAAEPMLRNPANMDIDARGRVWITEGANYRMFQKWGKLRPEGDRIVILEDTDVDGIADSEKTFYQGNDINSALGICVLGNRVIVSCSPNVFVFTDSDGDDQADKKEVLFTGISGVDHDHGVHAFVFGPDGKLYFNMGNDSKQLKRPDGSPVIDLAGNEVNNKGKPYRQGLVFRCNLDGSDLEVLGHNFRNNYEVAVDSFGTLWQSDNDDDGNQGVRINYVMEFGNFGYTDEMSGAGWQTKRSNMEEEIPLRHWHQNDPGVVPNLLLTGAGSPTGILVYEGALLPEIFRNQLIHCDAGPRVVRAYRVAPDSAGYRAEIVDILTSDDTWFRPSDTCVAPDGSLYVADWNDAGVGGHNMADQKFETMTGRVYRVAPKGHKPVKPKLDLSAPAGCLAALQSPNHETRYLAWTVLHQMQAKAEPELLKLWNGTNPRMRSRAFYLLSRMHGKERTYIDQALRDQEPNIRIAGLRSARLQKINLIPLVKRLVKDPSPQVRRECAIALRHSHSPEAPQLWAELAQQHDGKDRWYLEALGIGADKNEDKFFEAWLARVGNKWNTPAGRDIIWRSRSRKTPPLLVKIISDANTSESERARCFRALDFITGPEKEAALVQLLTSTTGIK